MLDYQSLELLKEVIKSSDVTNKDLQIKFELTRRQVDYRFKKINDWLSKSNLPLIERTKQGDFIVSPTVQEIILGTDEVLSPVTNIPNSKERANLILLMLLKANTDYSLNYFMIELKVSKNTILGDMKKVHKITEQYQVKVKYSRQTGYELTGSEFNIRRLLIETVGNVLKMINGEAFYKQVTGITNNYLENLYHQIEEVEKSIDIRFTDEKVKQMPYILALVFNRIQSGFIIDTFSIGHDELSNTKEYRAAEKLLLNVQNVPLEERLFITLKLLSTNVLSSTVPIEDVIPDLKQAIEKMLQSFETETLIELKDKDQLLEKIMLHIKPAYYRIKYNLSSIPTLNSDVSNEFKELYYLVKKSSWPLTDFLEVEITEVELSYLTMLIGGWLTRQGDSIRRQIKAIVVCPKGVSVSRLLMNTLSKLFPEFVFIDSLSVREFKKYKQEFHIVFSTEFLNTSKQLFIIETFLTSQRQMQLRKQVLGTLNGYNSNTINWDEVIDIISKSSEIYDEKALIRDLSQYFSSQMNHIIHDQESIYEKNPSLSDLITQDNIICISRVNSYEEAIRIASKPLLANKDITEEYIEEMVKLHVTDDPYAILGNSIAIPHAGIEDGVNCLAMSLLKIDQGLEVAPGIVIYFVSVIAPDNEGTHLRALQQLDTLSLDKNMLEELKVAQTNLQIYKLLANINY